MSRKLAWFCSALLVVACALRALADDAETLSAADAKAALEGAGFKVTNTAVTLPAEVEFTKQMKDLLTLRKNLQTAEKELAGAEGQLEQFKAQTSQLKLEYVKMTEALAGNLDVATHNRIVAAARSTSGKIDLMMEQQPKMTDAVKQVRGKTSEVREKYIEQVLSLRHNADKIEQIYNKAATDAQQQKAFEVVGEAIKKKLAIKPTPAFATAERQLQGVEDKVLSESIKIRDDRGTPWVTVSIDGKHTQEMVVDSGSSAISLPFEMAKAMNLEPNSTDPQIQVQLADGSLVPAHLKKIKSVRVGKFTVEDVECVVLSAKAVKAQPLLGMSFLGQFKFEVDTNKGELKMVKVDIDGKK